MAIAASTVPAEVNPQEGEILRFPIVDTETIYKGDIVRVDSNGEATSTGAAGAGDMFVGVAMETVDNTDDGEYIKVYTSGVFPFTKDTPAQTDVGRLAYNGIATNQQTVLVEAGVGTGSGIIIGAVVSLDPDDSTRVLVKIQPGLTCGIA